LDNRTRKRWHSISVDTLRVIALGLLAVGLAGLGVWQYQTWRAASIDQRAAELIAETEVLIQRFQTEEVQRHYREEYQGATQSYREARQQFQAQRFQEALDTARQSRGALLSIGEALRNRSSAGEAQFMSVQGDVQYRRAVSSEWRRAQQGVILHAGDYVRTGSSGSSEIMFRDLTFFTVRPNTQVVVAASRDVAGRAQDQAMKMDYGWIDLNTSKRPSTIATPGARARVEQDSEAFVTYEQGTDEARFGAYRGALEVASTAGETRQVGELEQVLQAGSELSQPRKLPPQPALLEPGDNHEVNLDRADRVVLAWEQIGGARGYALQIAESRLFVDNVLEVRERIKNNATLGLKAEGSFLWRVAAIGADGAQSPWSAPRRFRVSSLAGRDTDADRTPPVVEVTDITSYGALFLVEGRTEPGALVTVNSEPTKVDTEGTFTKTIEIKREGWASIEIRSRDAWGNETSLARPVYVEIQ
jgi:hypothetical protein